MTDHYLPPKPRLTSTPIPASISSTDIGSPLWPSMPNTSSGLVGEEAGAGLRRRPSGVSSMVRLVPGIHSRARRKASGRITAPLSVIITTGFFAHIHLCLHHETRRGRISPPVFQPFIPSPASIACSAATPTDFFNNSHCCGGAGAVSALSDGLQNMGRNMVDEITREDEDEREDEAYALDTELVDQIIEALEKGENERVRELVAELHTADFADLLEQIDSDERESLIKAIGDTLDAEALSELEESVRDEVLSYVDPAVLANAVKELNSDDVVYLVEDLEDEQKEMVLQALDADDRIIVEQSLSYPEDSAGRMMQRELVKAPPFWTVGHMIDAMRAAEELPDPFYEIIVVDPAMRPLGTIPIGKLMGENRPVLLSDIMSEDFRAIPVTQESDDVAYAFSQYHLVSAPVVDEDGRLVGVITIDDAVEAMDEEAEEDMLRLGGVGDESIADRVWDITKSRFPWLAVNLLTAILASMVIEIFEGVIQGYVALAVLMPIVASMGGNAGTQSLTVAVRALATRDLTASNMWRVVLRETLVGLMNGCAFAVLVGLIGYFWFSDIMLGVVLGIAMIGNLLVAALAGILVPITLDKFGADPALAAGTFVTTVTDVVGFFLFLGLGGALLL